jgi:hypothetical protein
MPEGGSGREEGVEEREVLVAWERGLRRVVRAWTLCREFVSCVFILCEGREKVPVKRPCKDEVVVDAQLIETLGEITLENQPASLVDYDESKDDPVAISDQVPWRGLKLIEHT